MNTRKFTLTCLSILVSLVCLNATALAHDTWITVTPYQVQKNTVPGYTVFNSHHFPAPQKDVMAPERLKEVFFVNPAGSQIQAGDKKALDKTGTYVAVAVPVNGFVTKTPDGYKVGKNKKDVTSPILCRKSLKFAKAVFSVGSAGGSAFSTPLGHDMEIIPLKDPAALKQGDVLPVRVLMEGKPARTYVFGTYSGFSEFSNTFAYTTRTDKEGIAQIELIHGGAWVLIAKHEAPFPDETICDTQRWAASLTFEVK